MPFTKSSAFVHSKKKYFANFHKQREHPPTSYITPDLIYSSGVASQKLGGKMYDFRRITLFCMEKRLSMHKMTVFSKHFGAWPPWLRL